MPVDTYNTVLTIPAGQAYSQAISFADYHTISMWMPDAWTAADLSIQASLSGTVPTLLSEWRSVWTETGEILLPAAADRVISVVASILIPAGTKWVRVASGSFASPVNQVAQRQITAAFRRF